uniref:Heat shock protein 21.7 n=1 Tax=Ericerus pela TaxID=931557 RepID=M1K1R9_ERIPE|nr:heat shock protein 21.7 [Ericerus pela]
MSVLPYALNDWWYDARDPFSRLYDQHFGMGVFDDDIMLNRPSWAPLTVPLRSGYLRTLRPFVLEDSGVSSVENEEDKVKINLDVQQFKPEEISVKIVDDYLVIEGNHEEKQDQHGYVSRQFTRRYRLPENIIKDDISSSISSDGVLSIVAPKKPEAIRNQTERQIPITRTNTSAIKHNKGSENERKK